MHVVRIKKTRKFVVVDRPPNGIFYPQAEQTRLITSHTYFWSLQIYFWSMFSWLERDKFRHHWKSQLFTSDVPFLYNMPMRVSALKLQVSRTSNVAPMFWDEGCHFEGRQNLKFIVGCHASFTWNYTIKIIHKIFNVDIIYIRERRFSD